jgi:hypothetical protein
MKKEKILQLLAGYTITVCFMIFGFYGCSPSTDTSTGPSSEDILKKYEGYKTVNSFQNKLGIKIDVETIALSDILFLFQNYTSSYLAGIENSNEVMQNMESILLSRFIVLDAANPAKPIEFETAMANYMSRHSKAIAKSIDIKQTTLAANLNMVGIEVSPGGKRKSLPRFILVGFKGIKESESVKWSTPALFYLLQKEGEGFRLLIPQPLSADNLLPENSSVAQFVEAKPLVPAEAKPLVPAEAEPFVPTIKTEYTDQITLGGGKTLSVSFVIKSKGEKREIEKCEISVNTHINNGDGSSRGIGHTYYEYNIEVETKGKFSAKISDFVINGTITQNRITGSIRMNGRNYSYSAKK